MDGSMVTPGARAAARTRRALPRLCAAMMLAGVVVAPPGTAQTAGGDHARFGERVVLGADTLVVAAPEHDGSGRLYVFAHEAGAWRLQQHIDPDRPCAGCGFGSSLALDGTRLAVGEPGSGSAYVYRLADGVWTREVRLRDPQNPALGAAVAISGETAIAASADGQPVTVFARDAEDPEHPWTVQARLAPGGEHARFGSALAIAGGRIVAGDPAPRQAGGARGTIHLFEYEQDEWGDAVLLAQADNAGDGFGGTLALLGDTLLVGVPGARRAYVYTDEGSRWRRSATLQPEQAGDGRFGTSVSLAAIAGSDELYAMLGAPLAANGTRREAGMAQMHVGRGADWSTGLPVTPVAEREAHAGWDVAIVSELAAVGIPDLDGEGVDRGAVAAYSATGGSWAMLDAEATLPDEAPVIDEAAPLAFDEGARASLRLRLDDPDTPLDALAVSVQSSDESLLADERIEVRDALGGVRVELDPEADAHGAFELIARAGDGRAVATRRVPVLIRAVNDAPDFALDADPVFPARPGTAQRTLTDFVRGFDPGPREADQLLVEGLLQEIADPDGVVAAAAVVPAAGGRSAHLVLQLSGRAGNAQFELRVRDSGGRENGGEDVSASRRFTVTVAADPAALFFDGFED